MKINIYTQRIIGITFIIVTFAFASLSFSPPANAETSREDQMQQIQTLLKQIEQLQALLAQRQASDGDCMYLSRNLYMGLSDAETNNAVSMLQQFLTNTRHYNYGEITGYYGPATQRAVQSWQSANGVVSYGTPDTTGYGVVGPSTRAAMSKSCMSPNATNTPIPVTKESLPKEAHEPAYLSMSFETETPINVLRFNVEFGSEEGEGLLKVYFDGDLVHTIDQRFARKSSKEEVYIGGVTGTREPGKYSLAIRLDGFGDEEANVEITDLQVGLLTYTPDDDEDEDEDEDEDDKEIIGKKEFKQIVMTVRDGIHTKRGTYFEFHWGWNGTRSTAVDIYVQGEDSLYEVATNIPDSGRYNWSALSKSQWDRTADDGDYKIIVCPTGKDIDSDYCDDLDFVLFDEDTPEITDRRSEPISLSDVEPREKSSNRQINIYSPNDGYEAKQGTQFRWTWGWIMSKPEKVDIFIEGEDTVWVMAEDYPNNGNFGWNAGSKSRGWSKNIPNGDYNMIVCPAGKDYYSSYCDSFLFTLHGIAPEVVLVSPRIYDWFKRGTTLDVTIGSMIKGDLYEIQLEAPALVSGETVITQEIIAASHGMNTYQVAIPASLEEGRYMLDVFQRTLEGVSCVNSSCASESAVIQVLDY